MVDSARYRIGVDIGGTFTDVVLLDTHTQQLRFTKVSTTPADPAVGFFAGVEKVLVVRQGKTAEVRVTTGRRLGVDVEIVDGLKRGEAVVARPGNLTGGQPVKVIP